MTDAIPFNRPSLTGKELEYIGQAIARGHASAHGVFSKKCCELLEHVLGGSKVVLTTSCTDALEMAAILLDIKPGDEVLMPSFTFVSTANAFVLRGAHPVFVDSRPDTLNMDEGALSRLISKRTRCIVPVHYAGVGCEMDAIVEVAAGHGLDVVEDNAHGLLGRFRGRPLGTFGALATLSFHETKNISCGEGGALIINDARYVDRADVISQKGTNRTSFARGEVSKYTWVDIGSSFQLSDLLAAFLYAQLESRQRLQAARQEIWQRYRQHLELWAKEHGVRLPYVPVHCEQSFHMFYLIMPNHEQRQALIAHLQQRGIHSVFHYQPLHLSEMGRRFGGQVGDCPVTEDISRRLVRLPFFNDLAEAQQMRVIEAVQHFDGTAPGHRAWNG